jgi:hypothetical protein
MELGIYCWPNEQLPAIRDECRTVQPAGLRLGASKNSTVVPLAALTP